MNPSDRSVGEGKVDWPSLIRTHGRRPELARAAGLRSLGRPLGLEYLSGVRAFQSYLSKRTLFFANRDRLVTQALLLAQW